MEIIKEYIKDKQVIIEMSLSKEEHEALTKVCENNNIDVENLFNYFMRWSIENPKEFEKWIKENRNDRCEVGILGRPLFSIDDEVGFYLKPYKEENEIFCKGKVYIVDSHGTMEQNDEPSYDIMVENFNNTGSRCLVKHVRESSCYNLCNKTR